MNTISVWTPDIIKDKVPEPICSGTLEYNNIEELAHEILPYGISTATYINNYRKTQNVIGNKCLCYDIDNGTNHLDILDKMRHYKHMILASMNHKKDKNDGKGVLERYHIFIELDKPITTNEFYKYVFNRFAKETFGLVFDKSASDICRFFAPHKEVLSFNNCDNLIKVSRYETAFKTKQFLDKQTKPITNKIIEYKMKNKELKTIEDIKKTAFFQRISIKFNSPGDRYDTMRSLIWFMKKNKFNKVDCIQLVNECFPYIDGRNWTQLTGNYYDFLK